MKQNDNYDYIDYDNLDSDDDEMVDEATFSCDQCEYSSRTKSSLTRHVKTTHDNACEECDFMTTNRMHLKMHVKACHKKNVHIKANDTKKRKPTDEIASSSSGKKKKTNVISKKVGKGKC